MMPVPRALGVLAVMPLILAAITEPQVVRAAEAPSGDCAETLVAFSPCLPFVSSSPNNLTSSPPPGCCKPVNDAFRTDAACLCHLVLNRSLLGFPLNVTRLVALSSLCRSSPGDNRDDDSSSLSRLCFFRQSPFLSWFPFLFLELNSVNGSGQYQVLDQIQTIKAKAWTGNWRLTVLSWAQGLPEAWPDFISDPGACDLEHCHHSTQVPY
ncbi:hypothetical protein EJ110_NYTH03981 [Nymphaea thermarum]|nr:hypothetical protein EJ110_NYTH03981 [Nymphaea thermarum]